MGKKYVIEIPDDKIGDFIGSTHFLMPYMMAGHIGHHDTGLPIEPYTEPDLDAIRNEAYEKGVQDTKQHWVDAPRTCAYKLGYDNGLNDAWEAVRKIELNVEDGGIPTGVIEEIFGTHAPYRVLMNFTASEVVNKLKAYEQEQDAEIKAGKMLDQKIEEKFRNAGVVVKKDDRIIECNGMISDNCKKCIFGRQPVWNVIECFAPDFDGVPTIGLKR